MVPAIVIMLIQLYRTTTIRTRHSGKEAKQVEAPSGNARRRQCCTLLFDLGAELDLGNQCGRGQMIRNKGWTMTAGKYASATVHASFY